jgi:hypothetical protein
MQHKSKSKAAALAADIQQLASDLGCGLQFTLPPVEAAKPTKRSKKRQQDGHIQQQQQLEGGSSSSAGEKELKVDAPLSLFELMVLLPGQQVEEVQEVQEMLGWLLFSDDH